MSKNKQKIDEQMNKNIKLNGEQTTITYNNNISYEQKSHHKSV